MRRLYPRTRGGDLRLLAVRLSRLRRWAGPSSLEFRCLSERTARASQSQGRPAFSPAARRGGSRHPGTCTEHTRRLQRRWPQVGVSKPLGRPEGMDGNTQSRHVSSGATEPRTPLEVEVGLEQARFTFGSEGFPASPRTRLRCPAPPHTSLWDCSQGRDPLPGHRAHRDPRVPLSASWALGSLVHGSVS